MKGLILILSPDSQRRVITSQEPRHQHLPLSSEIRATQPVSRLRDQLFPKDKQLVVRTRRLLILLRTNCLGLIRRRSPSRSLGIYWHAHSFRRPCCHIQAAALALATGSKISRSANGVPAQVALRNWNNPKYGPASFTAFGSRFDSHRPTRNRSSGGWLKRDAASVMMAMISASLQTRFRSVGDSLIDPSVVSPS